MLAVLATPKPVLFRQPIARASGPSSRSLVRQDTHMLCRQDAALLQANKRFEEPLAGDTGFLGLAAFFPKTPQWPPGLGRAL